MLLSSNTASNKDINSSTASCCFAHQTKWKQKLRLHKSFAEMTSHLSYSKTQAAEYKKNYNYLGSENGILNETASCWLGVQSIWIWPACITGENRWLGKRFLLGESCNAALGQVKRTTLRASLCASSEAEVPALQTWVFFPSRFFGTLSGYVTR